MANTTPGYQLGHDTVLATPNFRLRADRSGYGVATLELIARGKGLDTRTLMVGRPMALFEDFVGRTDLPIGTVMFAPDVGQNGSYWRYLSPGVWIPDRPFALLSLDTPISTPQTIVIGSAAFTQFGPSLDLPVEFWNMGVRRLQIVGDLERTAGTGGSTAMTQILMDGAAAPIFTATWAATVVLHQFSSEFWVSAANKLSQRAQLVFSTGAATAAIAAGAPSDIAVTSLDSTVRSLRVGVIDPSAIAATFKLVNIVIRVVG